MGARSRSLKPFVRPAGWPADPWNRTDIDTCAGLLRRLRAATSVLRSSIAIVIGPTPPGTGVIAPRPRRRLEVDVADEAVVGPVDADVDHGRAGLDPVGRH